MTTNNFDAGSALLVYTPTRDTTAQARLWAIEATVQTLAELGMVTLFEGAGTNPTTLSGYATSKLWLQLDAGVTTEPGTVRAYDGSGDATLLASWPALDKAGLRRHLELVSSSDVTTLLNALDSDDIDNASAVPGANVSDALDALAADSTIVTTTRGDLIRRGASGNERLPLGSSGQALLAGSTDPAWYDLGFKVIGLTGADTTGATDAAAAIQTFIDANKGKMLLVTDGIYLLDDVILLDGATYDGTTIAFTHGAKFKMGVRPYWYSNNFQQCWAGIALKDVDNVLLDYPQIDGNRTNQPIEEHIHAIVVAGSTNITIQRPRLREVRGDGIYVCQSNMTSSSDTSQYITITDVDLINSAADGRNVISIVGGSDVTINGIAAQAIGGTLLYPKRATCTVTSATPAVVTSAAHGNVAGNVIRFSTDGTLPTGISANTNYYVIATGLTTDAFQFSATVGGTAVNTSSTGSGTHVWTRMSSCTISNASPAVITATSHGLVAGDRVVFGTTGALPTGLTATDVAYIVMSAGLTTDAFQVCLATDQAGTTYSAAINTSSSGSGTHTFTKTTVVVEPGAFIDVEPDHTYQTCRRIVATNLRGTSYGTTPIAIQGQRTDQETTRDVTVTGFDIYQLSTPTIIDAAGALTQTNNQGVQVSRCTNVRVTDGSVRFINAWGIGVIVTASYDVKVDLAAHRVHVGQRVGADNEDSATSGVWNSDINVHTFDCARYGVSTGKITNTKIRGQVETPVSGMYTASLYAIIANTYTQTDCSYSVNVSPSTNWVRTYRNNGATFVNTEIRDCKIGAVGGYSGVVPHVGDMQIPRYNVTGVTNMSSAPTGGGWAVGTFVRNDGAAIGTPSANKILMGWQRVTTGSGNVMGTDWHACVVANS